MVKNVSGRRRDFLMKNLRQIFQNEGPKGFFKGLPAVLIGTIPSRAIYFYSYNQAKRIRGDNSPVTHIISVMSLLKSDFWTFPGPISQLISNSVYDANLGSSNQAAVEFYNQGLFFYPLCFRHLQNQWHFRLLARRQRILSRHGRDCNLFPSIRADERANC